MFFDIKYLAIFAFIAINFLTLFAVKTRVTTIISLIISHLVAIVFFSVSATNYIAFKEITLSLIVYSMILLFLVSSNSEIYLESDRRAKSRLSYRSIFFSVVTFLALATAFFSLFAVTQNIEKISETLRDKKLLKQQEAMFDPTKSGTEAVPQPENNHISFEVSERKKARLKDRLSDNFLFKRYSDVILLIVAASTTLLIVSNSKPRENQ